MKNKKLNNPFVISGFAGKEYFCDRKSEVSALKEAYLNNRNVTLVSLRRMGKSSLVRYLYESLKRDADCIYADIYSAVNFNEMLEIITKAITDYYGLTVKDYLGKISGLLKALQATMSFDDLTGKPQIILGMGRIQRNERDLETIFNFLEDNDKRVLFTFDEFQAIRNFPEKNTEAILRTLIQNYKNINFIFSGSDKGMMQSIFLDSTKPFYSSTQFLFLNEINTEEYSAFIADKFENGKRKIETEQINMILTLCRRHTYYVQLVCNRLYAKNENCTDKLIQDVINEILSENRPVYHNYKNMLTTGQWNLLKAVAKEECVKEPLSSEFIKMHNLVSSSSVQRSLKSLMKKSLFAYHNYNYIIYDVFFSLWLKSN